MVVTADGGLRGGLSVPLKDNADKDLEKTAKDVKILMFRHTGLDVPLTDGSDVDARLAMKDADD